MTDSRHLRPVNQIENEIIQKALNKIEPNIISLLSKIEYKLYISFINFSSQGKFPKVYLIPHNLVKIFTNLNQEIKIISSGFYFGFIKKNVFFLSLEGAEFLYSFNVFTEKNVLILNDEGEKSVLYGNQILKKYVHQIYSKIKNYDFLLVFNVNKELLAIAQSRVDNIFYQNLKLENLIAFNLIDKGYYLRIKQ